MPDTTDSNHQKGGQPIAAAYDHVDEEVNEEFDDLEDIDEAPEWVRYTVRGGFIIACLAWIWPISNLARQPDGFIANLKALIERGLF